MADDAANEPVPGLAGLPRRPRAADEVPNRPRVAQLLHCEHPQVLLTWGSSIPRTLKPDWLKLRKCVDLWPIRFTLKADYETRTRNFTYGMSCKDRILNGRLSVNLPKQTVEYRKKFNLPNGAVLGVLGSCGYKDRELTPNVSLALEFGANHGNAVWTGNAFDVRQQFKVARGLGVEVCGNLKVPTPSARYSADASTLQLGEGAFHIHVAEVNAILRL